MEKEKYLIKNSPGTEDEMKEIHKERKMYLSGGLRKPRVPSMIHL